MPQTAVFALAGSGINLDPFFRIGLAAALFVVSAQIGAYLYRHFRHGRSLDREIDIDLGEPPPADPLGRAAPLVELLLVPPHDLSGQQVFARFAQYPLLDRPAPAVAAELDGPVTIVYDQSGQENHLEPAPPGGMKPFSAAFQRSRKA